MLSQVHTCISYIDERKKYFSQHTATLFYITFYFFRIPFIRLSAPSQGSTDQNSSQNHRHFISKPFEIKNLTKILTKSSIFR